MIGHDEGDKAMCRVVIYYRSGEIVPQTVTEAQAARIEAHFASNPNVLRVTVTPV